MCALVLEPKPAATTCNHATAESLGTDANAAFLRCTACGQILVVQGGRTWAIRSSRNATIAPR